MGTASLLRAAAAAVLAAAALVANGADPGTAGLTVVGTEFRLSLPDGRTLRSAQLVGAVLDIAEAGVPRRVRIDGVQPDPGDASGEVLLHTLSVLDEASATWQPLCESDLAGRRLGFPFALGPEGNAFALTCTAGAEAKCIRMGYRPWKRLPDGRPLVDHFRACIPMMRADYCGDDRPSTRDGTTIDIYDTVGVQRPEGDPQFAFEAAWGVEGALCVAHTRIPENLSLEELGRQCPRLAAGNLGPGQCTEERMMGDARALVFNRSRLLPAARR